MSWTRDVPIILILLCMRLVFSPTLSLRSTTYSLSRLIGATCSRRLWLLLQGYDPLYSFLSIFYSFFVIFFFLVFFFFFFSFFFFFFFFFGGGFFCPFWATQLQREFYSRVDSYDA